MLVRLLYTSRALDTAPHAIDNILSQSRQSNPASGITGVLCYGGGIFLQSLEGGRNAVNALYRQIQNDTRHTEVVLLQYEEITERRFSGWTMGQVNIEKINPCVLLKHSAKPILDPYASSGAVSMALLEELMATAAVIGRT